MKRPSGTYRPGNQANASRSAGQSSAEIIDLAIEALRNEWRNGCNGTKAQLATVFLKRLNDRAASHDLGIRIARVETQIRDYRHLTLEQRREELPRLAEELKTLKPVLEQAERPIDPVGKLNSAIAPGREPVSEKKTPRAPSTVKALPVTENVTALPRVGDAVAKKLGNLGVTTIGDLLDLAPRRHIDYSRTEKIGAAFAFGGRDDVTLRGEVIDIKSFNGPPARTQIRISDDTGSMKITWFSNFVAKQLQIGEEIAVSGKLDTSYNTLSMTSPEWEKLSGPSLSTGRLTPVYPLTQGLAQKTLRSLTRAALDATANTIEEFLPESVRQPQALTPTARRLPGATLPRRSF